MQTQLSFREAEEDLKQFLAQQGYPANVLWVFREDLLPVGRKIFLRWPLPKANRALAEQHFESGRAKGLGVKLEAYCQINRGTCCFVFVPEDEIDAEYTMMTELKFSCPTDKRHAIKVRTALLWQLASMRFSQPQSSFIDYIPERLAHKS